MYSSELTKLCTAGLVYQTCHIRNQAILGTFADHVFQPSEKGTLVLKSSQEFQQGSANIAGKELGKVCWLSPFLVHSFPYLQHQGLVSSALSQILPLLPLLPLVHYN